MSRYRLAQLNIATLKAPLDSPLLADFVANLDRINQLAEQSPGFEWRLQDEGGDATALRPFGEQVVVNMSVWRDVQALSDYAFKSAHVEIMRRRRAQDPRLLSYKEVRSWRSLLPELVNEYVRASTGVQATAKDFRTWHATVLAAAALAETPEHGETAASRKRAVAGAMKEVSGFLGNTPTLARSSYVDPRVVEAYEEGRTIHGVTRRTYDTPDQRQAALERATLKLLREG